MFYRTIRLIAVVALCLAVLIPAVSYVALSVTPVQQRIARAAERELSQLLDAKVSIGSLGIVPFNRILLRNVVVTNREETDTLLTARRLGAGIRLMSLLTDEPVTVTHVELVGMNARIYRDSIGSPLNIQPVIDALKPKQDDGPTKPIDLKINTVMIRTSSLSYNVHSEPVTDRFNPHHITISNLRADITLPQLKNNDIRLNIKRMGFSEHSGLRLESLTANAHVSDEEIRVENLSLAFPKTNLRFADMQLPLEGLDKIPQALRTQQMAVSMLDGSYLSPSDFAAFFEGLSGLPDRVEFRQFGITGNTEALDADIYLTDGSATSLRVEGSARHVMSSERSINLRKLVIHTSGTEIAGITDGLTEVPEKTKAMLGRLGKIDVAASGNLKRQEIDFTLDARCAAGETEVIAEGIIAAPDNFSLEGEVATIGPVRLGTVLEHRQLGDIDGSVAFAFAQTKGHREGTADINIDNLVFKGVSYSQLLASASLDDEMVDFSAEIENDDIALQTKGAYSLATDNKVVVLNGSLSRFVPHSLNLTDKYPGADLSGDFSVDMHGRQFDNMLGHIDISSLTIRRAPNDAFTLDKLLLRSDSTKITLDSDFIDGTLQGSYNFRCIADAGRHILAHVFPSAMNETVCGEAPAVRTGSDKRQHKHTASDVVPPNDFSFSFAVSETERLAEFLGLPVSVIYPVKIYGEFSESTNDMALAIDAPYLRQGNKLIEGTCLSAVVNGSEGSSSLDFTTTAPTKNGPLHLTLSASGESDRLATDVAWKIARDKAYHGHVAAVSDFRRSDNGDLLTKIELRPCSLTFNDSTWTVNPAIIRLNGPRNISIDGINVHRSNQFVRINGTVAEDAASLLTLDLRNFNLDYLFESLGIDNVQLGGDATGTFYASRLLSPQPILETPGLSVSNISYNKVVLGDALVYSHWQPENKAITLNATVDQPNSRKAFIDGAIFPLNDSIDLRFNVDHTNVAFMQPYMAAFASDVAGHASGKCRLWGNFQYIDLEGDVFANDLKLKINFTNTYYTATDSVHFRPGLIDLNGITIRDAEGHTADLNGWVRHKFFKEPWFEFSISNANNFLSYNETAKNNPVWYGKIYGNGGATIKGVPGRIDINVDMATAPNSTFTFVLSDREVADEYSFLTFRDKTRLSAEAADTVQLREDESLELVKRLRAMVNAHNPDVPSDYNISLQMRVTPQAQLILVMDPVGGDRIRAWGSGHLRMDYGSANNDLRMYGTYVLDRGYYNFTLQDVIIKDFTIKPGSEIVFNGDPYAAQLNIQAIYALNANLSDLDESFLQDKDLNRTNVPVHALLKVMGDIRQPEIGFDLEFPTLTTDIYRKVRSIVSTDDMMNRQIIYLLALNRFYTPEYMSSTTKGNELVSVASSTISSQLSNLLGQISDNWNIAPTFRSDRGDFSDVEVDVALSSRLLNNRLLFNGNFGYRDNDLNSSQFIGDFDLEYLLDREGRWRLKAYNRYNDQNYYLRTAKTTQGVGVVLKLDFDSFFPFLRKKNRLRIPTAR